MKKGECNSTTQELTFDTSNYVVMANNMLMHSASNLSLDELKLLRFIIMQTKKGDQELYEFELSAKDFAKLLDVNIKTNDLYKRLRNMVKHLMQEVIYIGDDSQKRWTMFHWVDVCSYGNGKISIKISDELRPYLLHLKGNFARYQLSEIIGFKSTYAIRIYEILKSCINENNQPHADVSIKIPVGMDELRNATGTQDKFTRYSAFKAKVIDTALREINEKSQYHVAAAPYKCGNAVKGFDFLIESQAGYYHRTQSSTDNLKIVPDQEQLEGQKSIWDYETTKNHFEIEREEQ